MDHGHGLIDRILIASPLAFRPTLSEMETAANDLSTEVLSDFDELFQIINSIGENTKFSFDEDVFQLLRKTIDHFVIDVNDAIRVGRVPPKSKTPELVPRMAAALHVFKDPILTIRHCARVFVLVFTRRLFLRSSVWKGILSSIATFVG